MVFVEVNRQVSRGSQRNPNWCRSGEERERDPSKTKQMNLLTTSSCTLSFSLASSLFFLVAFFFLHSQDFLSPSNAGALKKRRVRFRVENKVRAAERKSGRLTCMPLLFQE